MQKVFSAWQPFAEKRCSRRVLLAFSWRGRGRRVASSRIGGIAYLKQYSTDLFGWQPEAKLASATCLYKKQADGQAFYS